MWNWISSHLQNIEYTKVIDVFGGSGNISFGFQQLGKEVTYNELLPHLVYMNKSLMLANKKDKIELETIKLLCQNTKLTIPKQLISFLSEYFLPLEAEMLGRIIFNIRDLKLSEMKLGLILFSVLQSCLDKRPFAIYNKSNLQMRKKKENNYWDIPFQKLIEDKFIRVNNYLNQFDSRENVEFSTKSSEDIKLINYDLVYLDPPFVAPTKNRALGNYVKNYFINEIIYQLCITDDTSKINLEKPIDNSWISLQNGKWRHKHHALESFEKLFEKVPSQILISYRAYKNSQFIEELEEIISNNFKFAKYSKPHINRAKIESSFTDILYVGKRNS